MHKITWAVKAAQSLAKKHVGILAGHIAVKRYQLVT